jgi:hypothetical protein
MIYSQLGFIFNFQYALSAWRQVRQTYIEMAASPLSTTRFVFAKTRFDLSEKEFSKNGAWYDVLKIEMQADSIIVYAIQDKEEEQLFAKFHQMLFQNPGAEDCLYNLFKGLNTLQGVKYLLEKSPALLKIPPSVYQPFLSIPPYQKSFFSSPILDLLTPPPDKPAHSIG